MSPTRKYIGFDGAHAWARTLTLGNPAAKSILRAVALYVDSDGVAIPPIDALQADTDISEDTIVRRLRWLDEIGAIGLRKRWKDDEGNIHFERRGKFAGYEIRVLLDADKSEIATRAGRSAEDETEDGRAEPASAIPEPKVGTPARVFVEANTEPWFAWEVFEACYGRSLMSPRRATADSNKQGWWFPSEYPPFGHGLERNRRLWIKTVKGSSQWWAWQERLKEYRETGSPSKLIEIDGKPIPGWEFPTEWPPVKGTGKSLMSKQDEDELAKAVA